MRNSTKTAEPTIQTVLGPVSMSDLGVVLPHEHVFTDVVKEMRGAGFMADEDLAVSELTHLTDAGGRTLVELTNTGIGRRPEALARVARRTGLNVIMGCGMYREPYLETLELDKLEVGGLADVFLDEIENGVGEELIKPGVIGEIGAEGPHISCAEERVLRAAGRASVASGLGIVTHAARHPLGIKQLDILESENVPPERVTIGHCGTVASPEYHEEVASRGAFVAFDAIRGIHEYDTAQNLKYIVRLAEVGHIDRILLSQDVCFRPHLKAYGGRGYDYLLREFIPRLQAEAGFSSAEISLMIIDNPRRALMGGVSCL